MLCITQKILRESFIDCGNDLEIVVDALAQGIGSTTGLERLLKPLYVSLSLSAIETDSATLWLETMECLKRSVESYKALKINKIIGGCKMTRYIAYLNNYDIRPCTAQYLWWFYYLMDHMPETCFLQQRLLKCR